MRDDKIPAMSAKRHVPVLLVLVGTLVMVLGSFLAAAGAGIATGAGATAATLGGTALGPGTVLAVLGLGLFLYGTCAHARARGFA